MTFDGKPFIVYLSILCDFACELQSVKALLQ